MLLTTGTKPALISSRTVAENKIPQVVFSYLKTKGKGQLKWVGFSPNDVMPRLAKQHANLL